MTIPLVVQMTVDSGTTYELSAESNLNSIDLDNDTKIVTSTTEDYEGIYTVSASTDGDIVLQTEGKKCTENITVNQLPTQTPAKPHITVNNNTGVITALVAFAPGYNNSYVAMSNNYTLQTQGNYTITPTTSEQTVLTKGTFITGTVKVAAIPTYDGDVEFTPTDETQTIQINGKMATENITINPVPNNYGKIEWNGSFLTVS